MLEGHIRGGYRNVHIKSACWRGISKIHVEGAYWNVHIQSVHISKVHIQSAYRSCSSGRRSDCDRHATPLPVHGSASARTLRIMRIIRIVADLTSHSVRIHTSHSIRFKQEVYRCTTAVPAVCHFGSDSPQSGKNFDLNSVRIPELHLII